MKTKGVTYLVWSGKGACGKSTNLEKLINLATRSVNSVKKWTELPTCLICDKAMSEQSDMVSIFDQVKVVDWMGDKGSCMVGTLPKVWMTESPFDLTLYLDTDTLVMNDLEYGFQKVDKHGLCLTFAPIYDKNLYNSGVIFFDKTNVSAMNFLNEWKIRGKSKQIHCDQFCLHLLAEESSYTPYVLPHTWNLRAQFGSLQWINGPIFIMHWDGPEPYGHHHWKIAYKRGHQFTHLKDCGGTNKYFSFMCKWICPKCGRESIHVNDRKISCKNCKQDKYQVIPRYWQEIKDATNEEKIAWVTNENNSVKFFKDLYLRERETEDDI